MDTANLLKPLNHITPFYFLSRAVPFRSFHFAHFKLKLKHKHFHLSLSSPTFCSLSERGNGSSLPCGVGEAVSQVSTRKLLQVVLVSPQIPGNTGCIARTCAASAVGLHLVGPLGFQVDDAKLKRAGLDYWPYVVVKVHDSWMEFQDYFRQQVLFFFFLIPKMRFSNLSLAFCFMIQDGEKRLLAFTKRGTAIHSDFPYRRGDYLIFGSETSGLPPEALLDCKSETFGGGTIRIPMVETYVRCLNLSVSVGIALYEASRQLNYEQLQIPSENCMDTEQSQSFITEDIFA
ncbi:hypothetical protein SO802_008266 [Lithocarpus litseifolius]|uniref:tRNA/rRNA methyltransferase SpoU type domain-containing protein n=1 Tax=Lithocarpus litseifolius TaxID=425828 RepID=A0AAW2D906_9ROSI